VCFWEDDAKEALLNAKIARGLHRSQKRKEIRAYFHFDCGHWHLTSQEEKKYGMSSLSDSASNNPAERRNSSVLQEGGRQGEEPAKADQED
jgi:hypothetical protein